MTRDQKRGMLASIRRAILERPGALRADVRRAACEGSPVPDAIDHLVRMIRDAAHLVTDTEIEDARRAGYDDDQLFELTIATALGESCKRFDLVLRALGRAR
jgi:hypothetical protein